MRTVTQRPLFRDYLSPLLACSAVFMGLTGDISTALALLFVAGASLVFGRFIGRGRALQPRSSHQVQLLQSEVSTFAARLTLALWAVVLVLAAAQVISPSEAARFAAALALSIVPAGLPGLIAWLRETGPRTDGPASVRPVAAAILGSLVPGSAALLLVLCSLVGTAAFHTPLGITPLQLVALDALVALPCLIALRGSREKSGASHIRYWPEGTLLARPAVAGLFWGGLLAGALAYTNYLLFFWRQGLSAEYITPGSLIHRHATTLAFLSLALCILADLLRRSVAHARSWVAALFGLLCMVCITYTPGVAQFFHTASASPTDWLYALAAAAIFACLTAFARHTRAHSRAALLTKHGHAKVKKHLELA